MGKLTIMGKLTLPLGKDVTEAKEILGECVRRIIVVFRSALLERFEILLLGIPLSDSQELLLEFFRGNTLFSLFHTTSSFIDSPHNCSLFKGDRKEQ